MHQSCFFQIIWIVLVLLPFADAAQISSEEVIIVDPISDPGGIRIVGELSGDMAKLAFFNDKARPVDAYIGNTRICIMGSAETKIPSSITDTAIYINEFLKGEYQILASAKKDAVFDFSNTDKVQIDCYGPFPVIILSPHTAALGFLSGRIDELRELYNSGELDRIKEPTARAFIFDIVIPVAKFVVGLNEDDLVKLAVKIEGPIADLLFTLLEDLANSDSEQALENALINAVKILESMGTLIAEEASGVIAKEVLEKLTVALEVLGRIDTFVEFGRVGFDQITTPMHVRFAITRKEIDLPLHVPYVEQGLTNWCGLATQCMLLRYYGIEKQLWEVAEDYGFTPQDGISGAPTLLDSKSYDEIELYMRQNGLEVEWYQWSHLPPLSPSSDEVLNWVENHINRGDPVAMFLTGSIGHSVVITGYEYDNGQFYVFVHDPSGALAKIFPDTGYTPDSVQMHIKVTWETFFETANSWIAGNWHGIPIPAVAPQRLMVVTNGNPSPKVGTLQLGMGSQLGISNSGIVAVYIGKDDGLTITELQMNNGLRWIGTIENGNVALEGEGTQPPPYWPSTGSKISLLGGNANMQFVHLTNGSSNNLHAKLHFMILQSEALDALPVREEQREILIPPIGIVPVGNIEMSFNGLETGSYTPAITVEILDMPEINYYIIMPPILIKKTPEDTGQGMLDCVFCIDTTGSMADDIDTVKTSSQEIIDNLQQYCSENNISLQLGLVTYGDHAVDTTWLTAWPLTSQNEVILNNIQAIQVSGGGDAPEDMYAAFMCAMNNRKDGQNQTINMGWREGAAKIIIPMCDAPPHDPDFEGTTLSDISVRAEKLDPVHMYPLLLPKQGSSFLNPAVRSMEKIAKATKGEVVRVNSAKELPETIVSTVKLAIRQHRNEVWRQKHPPYFLYGTIFGIVGLILAGLSVLFVHMIMSRNRIDKKNTNSFT